MKLSLKWAGRIYGTNTGNVYVRLREELDGSLVGDLHVNDDRLGVTVYNIDGAFDGRSLSFSGFTKETPEGEEVGKIEASGELTAKGEIEGDWSSTFGFAGRFVLFPHQRSKTEESNPDQLHIARQDFGPVVVSKSDIEEIAELIQKDFDNPVVITVTGETEQSNYLDRFTKIRFSEKFAAVVKIRAQSQELDGIARVVQVEFGPQFNFVLAQSSDEAWARGKRDMLSHNLKRFETSYISLWKKFGFGINQAFFVALLIFLPDLTSNSDRAILVIGFFIISQGIAFIDKRIRHASIRLTEGKPNFFEKYGATILSWSAGVIGSVLAGLLLTFLKGWLVPGL